jgi:hypothetical protein
MPVDERSRHRLYRKLEEILGPEEAGTLMDHLPATGFAALATKSDLESLEHRLTAKMEQLAGRLVMWTSTMVLAAAALAFAAGRLV